jgi:hypothetical protein
MNQDIDPAQDCSAWSTAALTACGFWNIHWPGPGLFPPEGGYLVGDSLRPDLVNVTDRDRGTVGGETQSGVSADVAGPAGDQGNFSSKFHKHPPVRNPV